MEKQNMVGYWLRAVKDNYANFKGRDTRPQYWWFFLMNFIVSFIGGFIAGAVGIEMISTIVTLVFLLPSIGAAVRRMHDLGKSGWFILIPIYNIILLATEGEDKTNEYGPNPRGTGEQPFDFENQQFGK